MRALADFLTLFFCRNASERRLRRLRRSVEKINAEEVRLQKLSDAELTRKTVEFRERLAGGASLDSLLPEAFAVVKNACRRLCGSRFPVCGIETEWNMIPFDVQIAAGIVLHQNGIAEMATGEGKTLAAAMPLYLNALPGKGAHLVTVNDYLAKRDSEWIGCVFRFLGMTVGCIQTEQSPAERRAAYAADLTYGTNSEFGFDYLRDNGLASSREEQVQRGHEFAIVDEVDSVLIDEARTPLVIAGEGLESENPFLSLTPMVRELLSRQRSIVSKILTSAETFLGDGDEKKTLEKLLQARMAIPRHPKLEKMLEDSELRCHLDAFDSTMHGVLSAPLLNEWKKDLLFVTDEKNRTVELTDAGYAVLDRFSPGMFVLPDYQAELDRIQKTDSQRIARFKNDYALRLENIHNLSQLILAHCLFEKDVHYIVSDGKILIVDEHTGRALPGRRFSDGLHQALEAKENVKLEEDNVTYASISQQNYFRLYRKLAGMTGTAMNEAAEFHNIYKMDVAAIPTNRPSRRSSLPDRIFRTRRDKFKAVLEDVLEKHRAGRPVLLGTQSVEDSETLSRLLRQRNVPHQVLNARQNQREAEIIANAGLRGGVTVATNMAGRGTDIKLGPGVAELGGLYVIGGSRHDARRIDNQLAGRCARQGDPGSVRFYVSLEDSFIRLFGSERLVRQFDRVSDDTPEISGPGLDRCIEKSQKSLEMRHYSIRKQTLDFDDVMNKHREVVYHFRNRIMDGGQNELLHDFLFNVLRDLYEQNKGDENTLPETFWKSFADAVAVRTGYVFRPEDFQWNPNDIPGNGELLCEQLEPKLFDWLRESLSEFSDTQKEEALRSLLLRSIDTAWIDHLSGMEALRDTVWFQSYAQKDPLMVYKTESYELFEQLIHEISSGVVDSLRNLAIHTATRSASPETAVLHDRKKAKVVKRG